MDKSKVVKQVADAREFTSADWLKYGSNPEPAIREKMILLTIEEIQNVGPLDFRTHVICDRLGIKAPNVNHFFGSRDGLLAEAVFYAQTEWIKFQYESMLNAPRDAKKRLRLWIENEITWGKKAKAMGVFMNYPILSNETQALLAEKYGDQMRKHFEFNLAMLTILVIDYRKKTFTPINFDGSNYPRAELVMKHSAEFLTATSISWATHGIASWSSGEHIASSKLEDPTISKLTTAIAVDNYVKRIMKMAEA